MKRGEVWVRASNHDGTKWGAVDVLDLDAESFRAWAVSMLIRVGVVVTLNVNGEDLHYRARLGVVVD